MILPVQSALLVLRGRTLWQIDVSMILLLGLALIQLGGIVISDMSQNFAVVPHVGAWVEIMAMVMIVAAIMSRPVWARGSKSRCVSVLYRLGWPSLVGPNCVFCGRVGLASQTIGVNLIKRAIQSGRFYLQKKQELSHIDMYPVF